MKQAIIADDELLSRELLKNLIKKYQLPIKIVGETDNGDGALALIREFEPDIAFLDIKMSRNSGLEVAKILKESFSGKTRVVIITAYDRFDYAQMALRLGVKDILLKPIDYRQLIDMLQRIGCQHTDHAAFNALLEHIEDTYAENLSLETYANNAHISPGHVARLFRKHFGVSFKTWVNRVKIQKAMELLDNTKLSIKEIADQVGYNNLNYFYRQFNGITGMTPKNYRA